MQLVRSASWLFCCCSHLSLCLLLSSSVYSLLGLPQAGWPTFKMHVLCVCTSVLPHLWSHHCCSLGTIVSASEFWDWAPGKKKKTTAILNVRLHLCVCVYLWNRGIILFKVTNPFSKHFDWFPCNERQNNYTKFGFVHTQAGELHFSWQVGSKL